MAEGCAVRPKTQFKSSKAVGHMLSKRDVVIRTNPDYVHIALNSTKSGGTLSQVLLTHDEADCVRKWLDSLFIPYDLQKETNHV